MDQLTRLIIFFGGSLALIVLLVWAFRRQARAGMRRWRRVWRDFGLQMFPDPTGAPHYRFKGERMGMGFEGQLRYLAGPLAASASVDVSVDGGDSSAGWTIVARNDVGSRPSMRTLATARGAGLNVRGHTHSHVPEGWPHEQKTATGAKRFDRRLTLRATPASQLPPSLLGARSTFEPLVRLVRPPRSFQVSRRGPITVSVHLGPRRLSVKAGAELTPDSFRQLLLFTASLADHTKSLT